MQHHVDIGGCVCRLREADPQGARDGCTARIDVDQFNIAAWYLTCEPGRQASGRLPAPTTLTRSPGPAPESHRPFSAVS